MAIAKSLYFNSLTDQGYKHRNHRSAKNKKDKWKVDRLKHKRLKRREEDKKLKWAHNRIKHAFIGKNLGKERESF